MLALLAHPSAGTAAGILRQVFGHLPGDFAFRLWDGTEVRMGSGEPPFTVVFSAAAAFTRLIRDPSPGNFAEAYVDNAIDIEGDLFAAMTVANAVEDLDLSLGKRLRILVSMWKG